MAEALANLQPAQPRDINVYLPYYQEKTRRQFLPFALSLYQIGHFEGRRGIEGGEDIPFVATWNVATLPADLTRCTVQFDGNADLSYEVIMANFEFIGFLIEVITNYKRSKIADFSKPFYRKLLKLDD